MRAVFIANPVRDARRSPGRRAGPRAQAGVSLLEVLIAVLVLGFGLLGVAAMQSLALRNNQSSMERSQAVVQTYAIVDAMRANADEARRGLYNNKVCADGSGVGTGASTLASADSKAWSQGLGKGLGAQASTCGTISCDDKGMCQVTVQWSDVRGGSARTAAADGTAAFTLKVRL